MKQGLIFSALSLVLVSAFSLVAKADCQDRQVITLHRYADAGNTASKVDTVKITVTPNSTTFKNLTGSRDLVVAFDGQILNTVRTGDTYKLNKSLRWVHELNLDFRDAPVKVGRVDMVLNLFEIQYVRQDQNGCLYLEDGGAEH